MAENGRVKENRTDIWLTGGFTIKLLRNLRIIGDLTWNNYGLGRSMHYKAFKEYGVDGRLIGTYPGPTPTASSVPPPTMVTTPSIFIRSTSPPSPVTIT